MDKLLSGRRILVVADEMLVLMMAEGMLADLGCESVTSAATVDQALALIDAQVFDAAMLDTNLNGSRSHAVAAALTARGVPFVFSTGYSSNTRGGYRDRPVLKKPYRYEQLAEIFYTPPRSLIRQGITRCDGRGWYPRLSSHHYFLNRESIDGPIDECPADVLNWPRADLGVAANNVCS